VDKSGKVVCQAVAIAVLDIGKYLFRFRVRNDDIQAVSAFSVHLRQAPIVVNRRSDSEPAHEA
jgi:hypothetical protein